MKPQQVLPRRSRPGSNVNEEVLNTSQISWSGACPRIIPRISLLREISSLFRGRSWHILNPSDRNLVMWSLLFCIWWSLCGVVVNVLDWDIEKSEFELQSCYYVHFRTNTLWERHEPSFPPSYGLNTTTAAVYLQGWLRHQIANEGWYAKPKQTIFPK